MITGSAARNPEELGPGFLNIHKTLMSLYSALHQGMSAIYIMLPLRSVTASLSHSLAVSLSLAPTLFFDMISFHKGPQSTAFSLLPPSLSLLFYECLHFLPMSWNRGERDGERGEKGLGKVDFSKGVWMGKVAFPSPVQRQDIRG